MDAKYSAGLNKLSEKVYAYLQPDWSWGLSNAGFVIDGGSNLIIDTLFDLKLTRKFLDEIKSNVKGFDGKIKFAVNTHANGDHFFGNSLINEAEIITSENCKKEMMDMPPSKLSMLMSLSFLLGKGGRFAKQSFNKFYFKKIPLQLPTSLFSKEKKLTIGSTKVELFEFTNLHTSSDIMAFIPDEKILFASDIAFIDGMPISWGGRIREWIKVLDFINRLDVKIIIPGHGPITDKDGIKKLKRILQYIYDEACKGFNKNQSILDTALLIDLKEFSNLSEKEKIITLVYSIYRELNPEFKQLNSIKLFALMAEYKTRKKM
jgi:cyclase